MLAYFVLLEQGHILIDECRKQAHQVYSLLYKLSNNIRYDWLSLLTHSTVILYLKFLGFTYSDLSMWRVKGYPDRPQFWLRIQHLPHSQSQYIANQNGNLCRTECERSKNNPIWREWIAAIPVDSQKQSRTDI